MFFFFNDTATTEIYTLSLHDALPICAAKGNDEHHQHPFEHHEESREKTDVGRLLHQREEQGNEDRKSTRLNSSHANISYAVFCLKKKKNISLSMSVARISYHA